MTKWLIILLAVTVKAWQAFDCEHPEAVFNAIDLTEPEHCPDPEHDYHEPQDVQVQVLQMDTNVPVVAHRCRITITKTVTRCGMDSIVYGGLQYPVWEENVPLLPAECRDAVRERRVKIEGREYPVIPGVPTSHKFTSQGSLEKNGHCEVNTFISGGVEFRRAHEETTIRIQVDRIRGGVDLSTGWVIFVNGLRAKYSDGGLKDAAEGMMVWESVPPDCKETVSELYHGLAQIHERRWMGSTRLYPEGSIVVVAHNETRQYGGLVVRKMVSVCDVNCYNTQIEGIAMCLFPVNTAILPRHTFKAAFDNLRGDIQSQLGYLHLTSQLHLRSQFREIQKDICELDRRTLFNKLQSIAAVSNPYALLDVYGPGYSVYVAGVVAYVTKCVPIEVVKNDYPNCTMEIPVNVHDAKGPLKFADPLTFVLKDYPSVIPCSTIMPVRWKLNGEWVTATPRTVPGKAPLKLNVTMGIHRLNFDITKGLDGGIYSPEQLKLHKDFQRAQTSREAVMAKVSVNMVNGGINGHLGIPLSYEDLDRVSHYVGVYMSPLFGLMGRFWSNLTAIMLLLVVVRGTIGCMIRAFIIYRQRGCGLWMLAAMWHTIFTIIYAPVRIVTESARALMEAVDEIPGYRRNQEAERQREELVARDKDGLRMGTHLWPRVPNPNVQHRPVPAEEEGAGGGVPADEAPAAQGAQGGRQWHGNDNWDESFLNLLRGRRNSVGGRPHQPPTAPPDV